MSYQLILSKPALRALRELPASANARIVAAIEGLKEEPRPSGCKKLKGVEGIWRIRVGDYRVVYAVDDAVLVVDVRRIGHRGDIYR